MLENLEVDDQQPSIYRNVYEGSTTNNRVLTEKSEDSNVDTSALLNNIKEIVNDYIVQTKNITEKCYKLAINEILESEINNSEM